MKYMQTGGFQNHPLMRTTLSFAALFIAGLWVTNFAMYFTRMGVSPDSVVAYYRGSEADFTPPKSAASMLETTHMHLPMMALVLLLLTHLIIFAPYTETARRRLIAASFLSAGLEEGSGWLVRFVHPGFAWLKLGSFFAFQAVLAVLLATLGVFLWSAAGHERRAAPRGTAKTS
ncbi:MAG: hypothetical protein HY925_04685 [Elusimicrobia bacterium]|nr:hypothetical protein [Elusimicrobiota bacterium]